MFYKIYNPINNKVILIETDPSLSTTDIPNIPDLTNTNIIIMHGSFDEANNILTSIKDGFLSSQNYRFTISKAIIGSSEISWQGLDLTLAPELGNYFVFNHASGEHEVFNTLTAALNRQKKIKDTLIVSFNLDSLKPIDRNTYFKPISLVALPTKPQPISTGTQIL